MKLIAGSLLARRHAYRISLGLGQSGSRNSGDGAEEMTCDRGDIAPPGRINQDQ
jgi:hypothetical protein